MASNGTGKVGVVMVPASTLRMPPNFDRCPAIMVNEQSRRKAGEKNGKPLIWSQWTWDSKMVAWLTFFRTSQ